MFLLIVEDAKFEESKHPRAENGEFGEGSGSGASSTKKSGGTKLSHAQIAKVATAYAGHHDPHSDSNFGGTAQRLNKSLRQGKPLNAKQQSLVDGLDHAIASAEPLKEPMTLYRGAGNEVYKKDHTERGYASTTTNLEVAQSISEGYETEKEVIYEIQVPKGARMLKMNDYLPKDHEFASEDEHILPRNAEFEPAGEPRKQKVTDYHSVTIIPVKYKLPQEPK
jgi:hypothetical protein